jgi:hypothetical protein
MNQDYAVQFLKLAGKCFAWVAALGFLGGLGITLAISEVEWWFVPAAAIGACFYAAIPICIFTAFIIACRAFGRKNDTL